MITPRQRISRDNAGPELCVCGRDGRQEVTLPPNGPQSTRSAQLLRDQPTECLFFLFLRRKEEELDEFTHFSPLLQ